MEADTDDIERCNYLSHCQHAVRDLTSKLSASRVLRSVSGGRHLHLNCGIPSREVRTLPHVAETILCVTVMSVPVELELAMVLLVSGSWNCTLSCCCPWDALPAPSPLGTNDLEDELRVSWDAKPDIQRNIRLSTCSGKESDTNVPAVRVEYEIFNDDNDDVIFKQKI